MHPSKLPGPDGMSPFFFQKYWHIVGSDVTDAVLSVSHSEHLLHKMNYTHIVLIPKKNDPKLVYDFRPISLGNVVCRILSKVIANCLKIILPNVISDSQSAFVPQWLITDNTTVAHEILHKMISRPLNWISVKHMIELNGSFYVELCSNWDLIQNGSI